MEQDREHRVFGVVLREYRLTTGLTQEALAARAGLGTRSIQHLERGESRPQRTTAHRLAAALALTTEQRHQFEALAQPVPRRLLPVTAVDLAHEVAPAQRGRRAHNLPNQPTSFIGRERELALVSRLLSSTQLLTLTGAGGIGKTRLALQVAGTQLGFYPQGVWLAELAPLTDPASVLAVVAGALGIRDAAGRPLLVTLVAALRRRHLLLVLDNCEHLLDSCAGLVEALLRGCPQVRVLATSREVLRVAGESMWRVPSLALPDPQQLLPPEALGQVGAVHLFIERAQAVRPDFTLTEQNATQVTQVCRRLDGIPLALELAAARLRGFSLAQLAARLDQRFWLLTAGSRTALPRQQTLHATVEWSYGLLNATEQLLFARLSVFAGSFSLESVEGVCTGESIASEAVLDLLLRLVDKSLVLVEDCPGSGAWYRVLETLRQYGQEQLAAGQGVRALRERHVAYYLQFARQAESQQWAFGWRWPERWEREIDNLRAALAWCLGEVEPTAAGQVAAEQGLRLAAALGPFWLNVDRREGLRRLEQAMRHGRGVPAPARARGCAAAAYLAHNSGERTRAIAFGAESVSLFRETDDKEGLAEAMARQGQLLRGPWCGESWSPQTYAQGTTMLEESIALARQVGKPGPLAFCLTQYAASARGADCRRALMAADEALRLWQQLNHVGAIGQVYRVLGWLALEAQDYARAQGMLTMALQIVTDTPAVAVVQSYLGDTARGLGDTTAATAHYERSLTLYRDLDFDQDHMAKVLSRLGDLALEQGDHVQARERYAESLRAAQAADSPSRTAVALEALGRLAVVERQSRRALQLAGAASALRDCTGQFLSDAEQARLLRALAPAVKELGAAEQATAWAEGQAMPLEQAAAYALSKSAWS